MLVLKHEKRKVPQLLTDAALTHATHVCAQTEGVFNIAHMREKEVKNHNRYKIGSATFAKCLVIKKYHYNYADINIA